jgi:hypothetical protein
MTRLTVVLALGILCAATTATAAWRVNSDGECVQVWTPVSLLRGPLAILNAPLWPLRCTAGPVEMVVSDPPSEWTGSSVFWAGVAVPPLAVMSGFLGVSESAMILGTGIADTVTGGAYAITSEGATELSLYPVPMLFMEDPRHPGNPETDPCGRPLRAR